MPDYVLPTVSAALGFVVAAVGAIGLVALHDGPPPETLASSNRPAGSKTAAGGPAAAADARPGVAADDDPGGTLLATLATELGGSGVVPTEGTGRDEDGRGTAMLRLYDGPGEGRVCFTITWQRLDPLVVAEVRTGAIGMNGPLAVNLFEGELPAGLHMVTGCAPVPDPAVIEALWSRTGDHYLMIGTTTHLTGAVRGQLLSLNRPPDLLRPLRGPLLVRADAAQETARPHYPQAQASGYLRPQGAVLAFLVTWQAMPPPAAGRIHAGVAGRRGPVAVTLFQHPMRLPETLDGVAGTVAVPPGVLLRLGSHPGRYYLRLDDPDVRDGAVRGQVIPGPATSRTVAATASGRSPGT